MFNSFKQVGRRLYSKYPCGPPLQYPCRQSLKYRPVETAEGSRGRVPGHRLPKACKTRLEELFVQNQKPDFDTVNALAIELNESYDAIWYWFRNRRERSKPPDRTPYHEALEEVYSEERYPKRATLETLARTWKEEYSTVYTWFYRRRKQDLALDEEASVDNPEFALNSRSYRSSGRYRLSAATREVLEDYFKYDTHPPRRALLQLSAELDETYLTVYRYFIRRRHEEKRRKNRGPLSLECKEALAAIYVTDQYPTRRTFQSLAKTWNADYSTLYNWFWRRRKREADPSKTAPIKPRLSNAALIVLNAHFQKDPSPLKPVLLQLSNELNRSYETIYRYFVRRRYESRKAADIVSGAGRPRLSPLSEPPIQRGRGRPPTKKLLEL